MHHHHPHANFGQPSPGFLELICALRLDVAIIAGSVRRHDTFFVGVLPIVIDTPQVTLPAGFSLVRCIQQRNPNSVSIFSERYGKGLSYLLKRRCPGNWGRYYASVCEGCISAIEAGEVATDDEIPGLLRSLIYARVALYPPVSMASRDTKISESVSEDCERKLSVLSPDQLKMLWRFYVNGERPLSICDELGVSIDQFNLIRSIARQSIAHVLDSWRIPFQAAAKHRVKSTSSIA